jgi:NADP-dependent 3-hydroxy acid dehydrogenase YdfG
MPLLNVDIGDLKRVYETNVLGIITTVQILAPSLIAAASNPRSQGGRMITSLGSIAESVPCLGDRSTMLARRQLTTSQILSVLRWSRWGLRLFFVIPLPPPSCISDWF